MKQALHKQFLKFTYFLGVFLILSCGSRSAVLSTPIGNIDLTPLKAIELTDAEEKEWSHLDLKTDTIPGVSLQRAYKELVKPKSKTIIVAVIDSGIDIDHEDLKENIWVNSGEIPNNGKDDDANGYIDDVNGWNFLGNASNEQLEYVRLVASGDTSNPRFTEAKELLSKEYEKTNKNKKQYDEILTQLTTSDAAVAKYLKKTHYTKEDVDGIFTTDWDLLKHARIIKQSYGFGFDSVEALMKDLKTGLKAFNERLDYKLNIGFDGRKIVGDNPNDLNDRNYGNSDVRAKNGRTHGTHVSGIIAAKRNNGIGINGAANNVKIMAIRNTPSGDEYDKDVALGVYYAVDNGAKVINMSFGKSFSPHSDWVRNAIAYAAENDVLIVAASGNDGKNTDLKNYFPNDQINNGTEVSNTFLKVGSNGPKYGSSLVASYSNYGKSTVDVFAPGSQIYSTYPKESYEFASGTSMAAPLVAGVAALIFSQYPNLSAAQVKQILITSGIAINKKMSLGDGTTKPFSELSKSGKIINAYNALIMASKLSK
ncbi:S8 family serine peptidase [Flavobacteriaceae bacterium]|jgi:subtilisin family serine protease|nr:S8 family serine peptidase [Flavobacteriaceae bacterium]MDA7724042.1 S8 family serine peptidase [Flavobacteriaceae bacterium]MDA7727585.1 S8 family serine peptidase [Flavobacteriaceae bacterium]MDB0003856.1 S8 family serine peptidase [Flavobacteriaceae bacterium]MDG1309343.1 S8 family serine peptidase [Flavobacteriaceae bacterium]